ncbi:MAG: hypothetical protein ACREM8_10585 [Vulcanimicrobiaceae bacterium]
MLRRLAVIAPLAAVLALGVAAGVPADTTSPAARTVVDRAKPVDDPAERARTPGLPTGLSYTIDFSSSSLLQDAGWPTRGLPGGVDAVLNYGISPKLRVTAAYYTVQEFPLGFAQGKVPLYLQGLAQPIGTVDLSQRPVNAATLNKIAIFGVQNLVKLGPLPIVITPTYLARTASIGGKDDSTLAEINGFPQTVHARSLQEYLLAVTVPFLSTTKMFGTYTIAPQWNVNTSGANQGNSPQLLQLLRLEYRPTPRTTIFFQPAVLKIYTPLDPYPQHVPTLIYGASYKFAKPFFIQALVSTGVATNPVNPQRLGITSLTCLQLPCSPGQTAVQVGGLKSTQYQLQIGIGQPSVIPL